MGTSTHAAAGTTGAGSATFTQRLTAGGAGGLAGGLVFGVMMQVMGMMGMIAGLVGSTSVAVGWVVHLAISALFGAAFTVLLAGLLRSPGMALLLGAVYGVVLWVIGPLLLMPAFMGMPVLVVDQTAVMSLIGHVIFGVILGVVAWATLRRQPA